MISDDKVKKTLHDAISGKSEKGYVVIKKGYTREITGDLRIVYHDTYFREKYNEAMESLKRMLMFDKNPGSDFEVKLNDYKEVVNGTDVYARIVEDELLIMYVQECLF